jgi:hypothetical protein
MATRPYKWPPQRPAAPPPVEPSPASWLHRLGRDARQHLPGEVPLDAPQRLLHLLPAVLAALEDLRARRGAAQHAGPLARPRTANSTIALLPSSPINQRKDTRFAAGSSGFGMTAGRTGSANVPFPTSGTTATMRSDPIGSIRNFWPKALPASAGINTKTEAMQLLRDMSRRHYKRIWSESIALSGLSGRLPGNSPKWVNPAPPAPPGPGRSHASEIFIDPFVPITSRRF